MEKLNDFVEWLGESPAVKQINIWGGLGGIYESVPVSQFDLEEEAIEHFGAVIEN